MKKVNHKPHKKYEKDTHLGIMLLRDLIGAID